MKCIQCQTESELIICEPCYDSMPPMQDLILSVTNSLNMLVHYEYRKIQKEKALASTEGSLLAQAAKPWDAYVTLKSGAANDEMVVSIEDHFEANE